MGYIRRAMKQVMKDTNFAVGLLLGLLIRREMGWAETLGIIVLSLALSFVGGFLSAAYVDWRKYRQGAVSQ